MLICHCKGMSHREVQAAIALGARDMADLHRVCDAGTACGGCRPALDSLLHNRHSSPSAEVELRPER